MEKDFKILQQLKIKNIKLYNKFESLLQAYEPFINSGALVKEVGYTPHDVDNHCTNIYRILSDILPNEFYQKSSNGENLFILIVGTLLHDYAMAISVDNESRREHSKKARELVLAEIYSSDMTVMRANIPRDFAEALGDIIYAHSDIKNQKNEVIVNTFNEIVEKYNEEGLSKGNNEFLNVPYLAAVLRLADELDMDYNRIILVGYEKKYNTEDSKSYFDKCMLFKKVKVNPKNERELLLEVDEHVFESLDESKKPTAAAQIVQAYEKVRDEFQRMKISVLFNTNYASDMWFIERISLKSENLYREYVEKKKN